ncbi:MAG: penicillin-binding protein 2 [Planctomycetota bacterium]|nr:MAG: penicillin-binding protein 2 [Planctomycetota bacterium]
MTGGPHARIRGVGLAVALGMTALAVVVIARVVQLQAAPGDRLRPFLTDGQSSRAEPAPRGDILDRLGRPIATTAFGWRPFVDPTRFPSPPDAAIARLAEALGAPAERIGERIIERVVRNARRAELGEGPIRYVSIGGPLDDSRLEAVRRLSIPGVHLERVPVRRVAATPDLAPVVGLVGAEGRGLTGAELAFDDRLAPAPGSLRYTRDARGRPLWVEVGSYRPPAPGGDVRLSVDLTIQAIAVEELTRGIGEADAAGGRVVVVDPATGDVLALADLVRRPPDAVAFDAALIDHDTGRGPRFLLIDGGHQPADRPALRRIRCVEDVYEPGSTFKPFVWSAVTERGLMRPGDTVDTHRGRWRTPYGRPLEDVTPRDRQTWREVLLHSSNIGMAQGAARLSHGQLRRAVIKLGFGRPTGLGLPGEASGIVTGAADWSDYTQTSVAMGYEVAVTPVQMARAFCAFARSGDLAGTLPGLRLTASVADPDAGVVHRVFPAPVALAARDAMRGVAEAMDRRMTGAGRFERPPAYPMFGKSGTANIPRPDGKGYVEGQYITSFIAGAPASRPRLVVLVVIDDPGPALAAKRQHYGSWTAGPVVRRIVDRVLLYLGEAPTALPAGG